MVSYQFVRMIILKCEYAIKYSVLVVWFLSFSILIFVLHKNIGIRRVCVCVQSAFMLSWIWYVTSFQAYITNAVTQSICVYIKSIFCLCNFPERTEWVVHAYPSVRIVREIFSIVIYKCYWHHTGYADELKKRKFSLKS